MPALADLSPMGRLMRLVLATAIVAGCASDPAAQPSPTTLARRTTTYLESTTTSTTTTTSTPTTTTTTTLPPTSTLPALPVPLPAPAEDGSGEPRIEIGSIEIPRLGLTRPMFEGIRLATLDNGPGHWPGTAMPGETGNVVVAGHRVSHNRDFRDLDQLEPGDEVILSAMSGRHVYRVLSTEIVPPDAMWVVDQTYARTATLFACHPPGSVRERIVVHLELAP
jgi:sortase A